MKKMSSENYPVTVSNLKKHFGNVKAVDGISFNLRKGEVFGLLGPNGAGKTTTIKLMLGLLDSDQGEIEFFGQYNPEKHDQIIKKHLGYVSEEPQIYKSLTPKELFNFVASVRELDSKEVSESLKEYMDSFDAVQYYNQVIATLSRGNKQKIQIIAALLHSPEILIMDEPMSGLDAKAAKVLKEILKINREEGNTVIFSTHIMEIAQQMCDRIAIIHKGKIVAIGTMEELKAKASETDKTLEDIFLKITEQDESIEKIVKKLRKNHPEEPLLNEEAIKE